jgi:putative ATPase
LIGATTENPSFTINNALLSRARVFVFQKLEHQEILLFLERNLEKIQNEYVDIKISNENLVLVSKLGD